MKPTACWGLLLTIRQGKAAQHPGSWTLTSAKAAVSDGPSAVPMPQQLRHRWATWTLEPGAEPWTKCSGCPVPTTELPFLLESEATGSGILNALGIPRSPQDVLDQSWSLLLRDC